MKEFEAAHILTPAKIILSGEHAVVYGQPALAMAVNRFLKITASFSSKKNEISLELSQFSIRYSISISDLFHQYSTIHSRYQKFLTGEIPINQVTKNPIELILYCIASFLNQNFIQQNKSKSIILPGIHLHFDSDIPVGCGMGSSAASVVGTLTTLSHLLDIEMSSSDFFQLAHKIENIQHGHSSGIDVRLAQMGGALKYQSGNSSTFSLPGNMNFLLVNSGQPKTTTGECVSATQHHFQQPGLAEKFGDVTLKFEQALLNSRQQEIQQCIKDNHILLTEINVVSEKVQKFISAINQIGAAGKICGAGSIEGEGCGILLVAYNSNDNEQIKEINSLCQEYKYPCLQVQCFSNGSHPQSPPLAKEGNGGTR